MYSLHPINENSRGIKTTLNIKYSSNTKDIIKQKQYLSQSIGDTKEMIRPEFMYNKNMLSSQAISIRNENNLNRSKKLIFSDSKIPSETPIDVNTFLK